MSTATRLARGATEMVPTPPPTLHRSAVEEAYHRHGAAMFGLAVVLFDDLEDAESAVTKALLDSCTPSDLTSPLVSRHELARYVYVLWARRTPPRGTVPSIPSGMKWGGEAAPPGVAAESFRLERMAIALAVFGDHTYREIALLMEVPAREVAGLMRSGLMAAAATHE